MTTLSSDTERRIYDSDWLYPVEFVVRQNE